MIEGDTEAGFGSSEYSASSMLEIREGQSRFDTMNVVQLFPPLDDDALEEEREVVEVLERVVVAQEAPEAFESDLLVLKKREDLAEK